MLHHADPSSLLSALEQYLVDQLLSAEARQQYSLGDVSHSQLKPYVEEVRRLSQSYTGHAVGSTLWRAVQTPRAAEAYALYYTPLNAAKIIFLASQLESRRTARILDFGSGPGTAVLALLSSLGADCDVFCVESCPSMRTVAHKLLSAWRGSSKVSNVAVSPVLPSESEGRFDIIVAAHSLAELNESDASLLIQDLIRRVAPGGYLLLVEPGQFAHTRRLMTIRDTITSELTPIFPCTRQDCCPMLASSDTDWCHGTLTWAQPRLSRQFDSLLGFNKHRIKYSAFIFQRDGALRDGLRVITPPKKLPRGIDVTVCARDEYGLLRINKGERGSGTRALERAEVFDRLIRDTVDGALCYTRCEP